MAVTTVNWAIKRFEEPTDTEVRLPRLWSWTIDLHRIRSGCRWRWWCPCRRRWRRRRRTGCRWRRWGRRCARCRCGRLLLGCKFARKWRFQADKRASLLLNEILNELSVGSNHIFRDAHACQVGIECSPLNWRFAVVIYLLSKMAPATVSSSHITTRSNGNT